MGRVFVRSRSRFNYFLYLAVSQCQCQLEAVIGKTSYLKSLSNNCSNDLNSKTVSLQKMKKLKLKILFREDANRERRENANRERNYDVHQNCYYIHDHWHNKYWTSRNTAWTTPFPNTSQTGYHTGDDDHNSFGFIYYKEHTLLLYDEVLPRVQIPDS